MASWQETRWLKQGGDMTDKEVRDLEKRYRKEDIERALTVLLIKKLIKMYGHKGEK